MIPLISTDQFPDNILSALGSRDVSLWIQALPTGVDRETIARFIGLPWHEVFLAGVDSDLNKELSVDSDSALLRKRGFLQIVQTSPAQLVLPPRSLPVYLLDSDQPGESDFDRNLRRFSMLGALRQSSVRRLLVISDDDATPPPDLHNLIDSGFHPYITFVSATERGAATVSEWVSGAPSGPPKQIVRLTLLDFVHELLRRYTESYIDDSLLVRFRTSQGSTVLIDLTEADDVERPILTNYEIIRERDLAYVSPEELSEDEFGAFFEGTPTSWQPYAAGLPWMQNRTAYTGLKRLLQRLEDVGPSENKIAYIASEPGAGGTTLARQLAWEAALEGFPTLVARNVPILPDALPVVGFLNRANDTVSISRKDTPTTQDDGIEGKSVYETPWVIVFDRSHWEQRENELRRFLSEIERSGRPVVVLVVIGPFRPLSFYSEAFASEIATLTHIIDASEARALGHHLNRYLRVFGKERTTDEWAGFHDTHSVQYMGSRASFWVALSFWLRSNRDFGESIQERIYQVFCEHGGSPVMKGALVEIAALSSQRLPLNEKLLPRSDDEWPMGLKLEDNRKNLTALGLVRLSIDGEKYWGLAHDILGRLLINALFYDHPGRTELQYEDARDSEHLRFLALRRVAIKPEIAEYSNRGLAEEFATTIFKVDPDHGARAFAGIWRDVLRTLDEMPTLVRDGSRVFRHHTAISRRRIAMLDGAAYNIDTNDQIDLLERAVRDIEYAINSIERTLGDEPDLHLYNSLANAYLNLADVKLKNLATREEVVQLRGKANEATHKAYRENPTSPFVVETHIRNLLSISRSEPTQAVSSCLEALQVTYEALRGENSLLRTPQLARLAEQALELLFTHTPPEGELAEPRSAIEVLLGAWRILAGVEVSEIGEYFTDLPIEAADRAVEALEHPAGRGDIQVLRLRYGVLSSARPIEFRRRIEILEGLEATDVRLSPQFRLEYALLLYQVGRAVEGDAKFRDLRRLWRNSEHFVRVPRPLDWLRDSESEDLASVQAVVDSDQSHRPMAKVREFGNRVAPFRPEEFDVRVMRPGHRFMARVSFGHNGPFLRPLGAQPRRGLS